MEKKAKQGKMRDILASLEKHKKDLKDEDYDKLLSAKTMGNQGQVKRERKESAQQDSSSSEDQELEIVRPDEKKVISSEVRAKVESEYVDMKAALSTLKREILDEANR